MLYIHIGSWSYPNYFLHIITKKKMHLMSKSMTVTVRITIKLESVGSLVSTRSSR